MMLQATYVGPNSRFDGQTALVRDDPNDPNLLLVQFDRQPFYVGKTNLGCDWHPFFRDHWHVDESSGKVRVVDRRPGQQQARKDSHKLFYTAAGGQAAINALKNLKKAFELVRDRASELVAVDENEELMRRLEEMGFEVDDKHVYASCCVCERKITVTDYLTVLECLDADPRNQYCGGSPRCCP